MNEARTDTRLLERKPHKPCQCTRGLKRCSHKPKECTGQATILQYRADEVKVELCCECAQVSTKPLDESVRV